MIHVHKYCARLSAEAQQSFIVNSVILKYNLGTIDQFPIASYLITDYRLDFTGIALG